MEAEAGNQAQRLIKWLDAPMASDPLRDLPRLASELLTTLKFLLSSMTDLKMRGKCVDIQKHEKRL